MLDELRKPFHPSAITWKPGAVKGDRALALAYGDLRAYMNRLDEVCGSDWSVAYEPWGDDRIICRLTIADVTRSSTGETNAESERSEIGGTVAEAQAFKRACAMFGLGRYLYNLPTGWADFDPKTKRFTEKAKARLMGILVQHYRRTTDGAATEMADIFSAATDADEDSGGDGDAGNDAPAGTRATTDELLALTDIGREYHKANWPKKAGEWAMWGSRNRTENPADLSSDEVAAIINKLGEKIAQRVAETEK